MISALAIAVHLVVSANVPSSATQDELIRQIVVTSRIQDGLRKALLLQMESSRKDHPTIPEATWGELESFIRTLPMEQDLGAIWKGQFTDSELRQILSFWKSPAGQKFFKAQPTLNAKTGAVGGLLGLQVYKFLQQKHPDQFPPNSKAQAEMVKKFQSLIQGR